MSAKIVVLLLVVAALALSVTAKDLDFALEYRGKCQYSSDKNSANCHLKSQSQEVLTRIKADGNVQLSVRKLIGSISNLDLFASYNFSTFSWTSQGSLSFGVHSTEKNHKVEFASVHPGTIGATRSLAYGFATTWKVTKGYGALDQAEGLLTANGVFDLNTSEAFLGVIGVIYYKGNNHTLAAN